MTTNRRGMIAAMSVLGVAALLFSVALARALTVEPWTPPEPQAAIQAEQPAGEVPAVEPSVPSEATLSPSDIALAVDNDPFLPDRTRAESFRFPGEDVFDTVETPGAAPVPHFQVTGTTAWEGGGVAVIHVDDSPPLVLGVGESLLGFRLDAVGANTATMMRGEQTLYLSLAEGTPQRAQQSDRNSRNANAALRVNADVLRSLQERFGEGFSVMLNRAVQLGGDQAQTQRIIEQMIQQGGRGRGSVRIRRDTTAVPLGTPDKP